MKEENFVSVEEGQDSAVSRGVGYLTPIDYSYCHVFPLGVTLSPHPVLRSRHSNRVTTQSSSPTSPAFSLCAWFPPTRRLPRGTTSMEHVSHLSKTPPFFYIIFCITWFPFPCRVMWHGNTQNSLNSKS